MHYREFTNANFIIKLKENESIKIKLHMYIFCTCTNIYFHQRGRQSFLWQHGRHHLMWRLQSCQAGAPAAWSTRSGTAHVATPVITINTDIMMGIYK